MCGHGTIGVIVALGHLGRIKAGKHRLETPVGTVDVEFDGTNTVSFENVPSFRYKSDVSVPIKPENCRIDIAWGGNWFAIVDGCRRIERSDIEVLNYYAREIRRHLKSKSFYCTDGAEVDHVEFSGPPVDPQNHSRNFVVCPGEAYDRSPCGTGTSAKIACLAADGKLKEGEIWRQESIIGSVFEASYRRDGDKIIPKIRGTAYVTGEATLLLDPRDPFVRGIRP
jgi:4-hydroxyproline epimerase